MRPGQYFVGLVPAFRIGHLGEGKGDLVGVVVLDEQFFPRLLDILPQKIGGEGHEDADPEDNVCSFLMVQHNVEKDRKP